MSPAEQALLATLWTGLVVLAIVVAALKVKL